MVFKHICVLVLWTKVASALEGLRREDAEKSTGEINEKSCCWDVGEMSGGSRLPLFLIPPRIEHASPVFILSLPACGSLAESHGQQHTPHTVNLIIPDPTCFQGNSSWKLFPPRSSVFKLNVICLFDVASFTAAFVSDLYWFCMCRCFSGWMQITLSPFKEMNFLFNPSVGLLDCVYFLESVL